MAETSGTFGHPSRGEVVDGKYVVDQLLSEGGMGSVVKAVHIVRRAPVALKFLNPKILSVEGSQERFVREAVAASLITSEHVVKVFDVGTLPSGVPFIVMEYLEGMDLAALVEVEGAPGLDPPRAVHFALQILRALQAAHAADVIHRDLKLSNCFVLEHDGERDYLKILDFGVSKIRVASEAVLTRANAALGTPIYMAPEQALSPRDVDARSDLYSVGIMIYKMLCGRLPYELGNRPVIEDLLRLVNEPPIPLGDRVASIPVELQTFVHRAMAKNPSERWQTATEMATALAPWSDARSARLLDKIRTYVAPPPSVSQPIIAEPPGKIAPPPRAEEPTLLVPAPMAPRPANGVDSTVMAVPGARNEEQVRVRTRPPPPPVAPPLVRDGPLVAPREAPPPRSAEPVAPAAPPPVSAEPGPRRAPFAPRAAIVALAIVFFFLAGALLRLMMQGPSPHR